MSDQPYKPTPGEGDTPKPSFHIGDDGVIHFDKPTPQPSKPDYNPNDDGNDEPPRRRWRNWLWIMLFLLLIAAAVYCFLPRGHYVYNDDSSYYETSGSTVYYNTPEYVEEAKIDSTAVQTAEAVPQKTAFDGVLQQVRAEYNGSYAYDNGGFGIETVDLGNTDYDGNIIYDYGQALYSDNMRFLAPKIYFSPINEGIGDLQFAYKIFFPDGHLTYSPSISSTYTNVSPVWPGTRAQIMGGYGNNDTSIYYAGDYLFALYWDGVCIYYRTFRIS